MSEGEPVLLRKHRSAVVTEDIALGKIARQIYRIASSEGYPSSMSKKKRVCVVTYRHSDSGLFENSLPPRPNLNNL
jgi:hypothetical protein